MGAACSDFGRHLCLATFLVFYEVALAAQRDGPCSFLLKFEQAGLSVAPLVPREPLLFLPFKLLQKFWLYCFFQSVLKGEVHTVRVNLDELVVSPVDVLVQEVVVELQHS